MAVVRTGNFKQPNGRSLAVDLDSVVAIRDGGSLMSGASDIVSILIAGSSTWVAVVGDFDTIVKMTLGRDSTIGREPEGAE